MLETIELSLFTYHPKFNVKSITYHSEQIRMGPGKEETQEENIN